MSKRLRVKVTPMTAEERAALREEDVFRGFTDEPYSTREEEVLSPEEARQNDIDSGGF